LFWRAIMKTFTRIGARPSQKRPRASMRSAMGVRRQAGGRDFQTASPKDGARTKLVLHAPQGCATRMVRRFRENRKMEGSRHA
jgi:hypothetical protein